MTLEFIMRDDGPLPLFERNYLAILASSLHDCGYLVSLEESYFIFNLGNPEWLEGIDKAPEKFQRAMKLMKLLAHEPWKITKGHIAEQLEGSKSWTVAGLVQMITIVCSFVSLSGLVFGMGLLPEVDMENVERDEGTSKDYKLDQMTRKRVRENSKHLFKMLGDSKGSGKVRNEEKENMEKACSVVDIFCQRRNNRKGSSKYPHYAGRTLQRYVDFNIKTEKLHRRQDYDWRVQGYGLMSRYYPDFAPLLNNEFEVIYNLTYHSLSSTANVDTGPFRRAVWYYVHRLYGIENDDYNYACINKYLNKPIKRFIKKCACFPQDVTKSDYDVFGYDFTDDEKCHVALLVVEARRQASIVFGLKALGKYLSTK